MQFSEDTSNYLYKITSIKSGSIVVGGGEHNASLIIIPNALINPWGINSVEELQTTSLLPFIEHQCEVVLLGTGNPCVWPEQSTLVPLFNQKIGVEVMSTDSACRTYNVLLSEGRKVGLGLIL